ncbi:estradiol 17-beta-dehydrogenase 2-like [Schistocerca nitens]|uniref:estradiol 17-beta-dehydrogenase 2-like n=1 Tax=Schistocerca nitens TaxID=7011 RepID=UPI00211769AC|nr:estradiol 17-beta-dehydrogenase 2-like [Schistocerca nitens]
MGAIRVSKAFLPLLKKSKGRLINVTSSYGRLPFPMVTTYCLSKSALTMFTDVLRMEMKKWSVTVCAVEPLLYETALTDAEYLQSEYVENTEKTLSDDKESIRQAARKNCEVMLRASKWLAKKNISEVIDEMVIACVGQNVQLRQFNHKKGMDSNKEGNSHNKRKGIQHYDKYKHFTIKKARLRGEAYINYKGQNIPATATGKNCNYKLRRFDAIDEIERAQILEMFKEFGSKDAQDRALDQDSAAGSHSVMSLATQSRRLASRQLRHSPL